MQKIMKVAYLIICLSVLFFVFSCLLSIPPSYGIEDAQRNVTIAFRVALDDAQCAGWLSISGIIVCRRGNVEIFPRHLFRRRH